MTFASTISSGFHVWSKNALIFYAFDLEQHPGPRNVKAFQAWGQEKFTQGSPRQSRQLLYGQ
jgi:hypothetical protein